MATNQDHIDYDIVNTNTNLCSAQDFKNLKNGVLEIDPANREFEETLSCEEMDSQQKKIFYQNLLASPYPNKEGPFLNCTTFQERIRIMTPVREGTLYKTIMRPGTGPKVTPEHAILFHMNAFLIESDDEPFDSTFARQKALLARPSCILSGYTLSLVTMCVGEMAEFAIHHSLAYGKLGCPPRIPANSDIIVIFEVIDVYEKGSIQYYHSLSPEEQQQELTPDNVVSLANQEREEGNKQFRTGEYRKAISHYKRAIDLIEKNFIDLESVESCQNLCVTLYQNISMAYKKSNSANAGVNIVYFSRRALRLDEKSVKANYLMGVGFMWLGKLEKSKRHLLAAKQSKPNDIDINKALEELNQRVKVNKSETKKMYQRMYNGIKQD